MDLLNGIEPAYKELKRYDKLGISIVTWMELLVGAGKNHEAEIRSLLNCCEVHELTREIAQKAVDLRRKHRLRIPDAVVWATALESNQLLVTRNTNDFPRDHPSVRIPYEATALR